jgi:hypothetical protein
MGAYVLQLQKVALIIEALLQSYRAHRREQPDATYTRINLVPDTEIIQLIVIEKIDLVVYLNLNLKLKLKLKFT